MSTQDLRTTRKQKGLRIEDLASGLLVPGTIISIEKGRRVPQPATRAKLVSILGPIDFRKTLAGGERSHIIRALSEFVNEDSPGAVDRIKFLKQSLTLMEQTQSP